MANLVLTEVSDSTPKPKGFRLNTQQIFLTYAQCDKTPLEIYDFLSKKVEVDKYIVAQEKHKDGNNHIHAYLLLKKKVNIKNARHFDLEEFHPKVEGCRSWKNVVKYVTKDGNYITNYDPDIIKKLIDDSLKVGDIYQKARDLAKEGKVQEGISVLEHRKTVRDLVVHGNAIQRNLRALGVKRRLPEFSLDDFNVSFEWDRSKSLILWGETNTGKTSLAKALLPRALFVTHKDRLKEYDENEYEGLIFDDMSFKHWPREAQIHIVDFDNDRQIDVKHGMAVIPARTPRIFTTNVMPAEMLLANDGAIARRIQEVFIDRKLSKRTRSGDCVDPSTIGRSGDCVDPVPARSGDSVNPTRSFSWVNRRNRDFREPDGSIVVRGLEESGDSVDPIGEKCGAEGKGGAEGQDAGEGSA